MLLTYQLNVDEQATVKKGKAEQNASDTKLSALVSCSKYSTLTS